MFADFSVTDTWFSKRITALYGNRDALTEEGCRPRFVCDSSNAATDFSDEVQRLLATDARRFECERNEIGASNDVCVLNFQLLVAFGSSCR